MLTDPMPRRADLRRQFFESDKQVEVPLPPAERFQKLASEFEEALADGKPAPVKATGLAMLGELARFYDTSRPTLQVLGLRPHEVHEGTMTFELFGDYAPGSQRIRVWMRTAILGKVTSYKGLLNTLLHEFCHHLDVTRLGYDETPHTRGFYTRIDELYHLALNTPPEKRKPLLWRKRGSLWAIDWNAMRAARPVGAKPVQR